MGRNKKNRVGEKFVNNENCEFIIIEYNGCRGVWVQFQDEYKAKVYTSYNNCQRGSVKNPYHPSICNHGYLGLMSDGTKPKVSENRKITREYSVWKSMVERVYNPNYPTYKDCIVSERWLCFANFLEDLPLIEGYELWRDNPNQRIALDKDIKGNGSKIYCLENCCFVTQSENTQERVERCGNPNNIQLKIYGINIETGEHTKIFNSMREVERELGIGHGNISECLKVDGRLKTAGGYKWYKVE